MDVFDNLAAGIMAVLTPGNMLLLLAGVMLGMIVGVMPGLGPSAGLAILLPLTFTMDPTGAVVMLAAVYYGAMYGGTITSVLINTPGESATVASTFDGYPLAKAGRAGPALVMAAVGSFVAGTVGAILISIAAPVTASVAASSGAMVPLLTLGIPGSASTAVLIGGFMMWGLQPGPLLMDQNPEFAWGLIASMYLGNVMLLLVNIFCIPAFASIARVPFRVLGPIIVVVCVLGTFTVNGSIIEVGIMLACGVLGFFMRRFGLNPAALVIALVLGPMAEESLRQTMIISGGSFDIFVERGTSRVLLAAMVVMLLLPLLGKFLKKATSKAVERFGRKRREDEVVETAVTDDAGQPEDPAASDRQHDQVGAP